MIVYEIKGYDDDADYGLFTTKELAEKYLQEEWLNEFPEDEPYYHIIEREVYEA